MENMMKAICALLVLFAISTSTTRAQQPSPQSSVTEGQWVCVVGNVTTPARITFRSGLTLLQAIKEAGGILPNSKGGTVYVHSILRDNQHQLTRVDLKTAKKPNADLVLRPTDIVEVMDKKGRVNPKSMPASCDIFPHFLRL
jgi:protein involved in polysaccharide export with SLBB domain